MIWENDSKISGEKFCWENCKNYHESKFKGNRGLQTENQKNQCSGGEEDISIPHCELKGSEKEHWGGKEILKKVSSENGSEKLAGYPKKEVVSSSIKTANGMTT